MMNFLGDVNLEKEEHRALRSHRIRWKRGVWVAGLILILAASGCAGLRGSGLFQPMSSQEKKKTLEALKENWKDYDVYSDGPASAPGAMIFDPRNDGRNLVGYGYIRLSTEDSVRTAIVWLEYPVQYETSLYRVFDEEKNFYGYVLIAHHLPTARRIDQKTLQLPQFESMFYGAGGGSD